MALRQALSPGGGIGYAGTPRPTRRRYAEREVWCKIQGVDPYTYLVDVLQRISSHPDKQVAQLTPRLWKEHFPQNPLRSDMDRPRGP